MTVGKKIVLLGVGNTAQALIDHYRRQADQCGLDKSSYEIYGTTRSADKMPLLSRQHVIPLPLTEELWSLDAFKAAADDACVLVSYPPPANAVNPDQFFAPLLARAAKIVYISSTGVYGQCQGRIDEETSIDIDAADGSARQRLASEKLWRDRGACVLRAPGLYGPHNGLHLRLRAGTYNLPGDGTNFVSRIHLDDLATIIGAAFEHAPAASLFVTGDLKPSTHIETVSWLCRKLNLPLPASLPIEKVGPTLRGNRQIDSALVRRQLNVELRYPTYVEGFSQCLAVSGE